MTDAKASSVEQDTHRDSETSHAYAMSQSTVDAQMEKVIDNIVELGCVHQFPQSLGHAEDKEKLLESIHRDITSERSSIDLIADVASQQQSIEIAPHVTITPEQNLTDAPSQPSIHGELAPDFHKIDAKPIEESTADKIDTEATNGEPVAAEKMESLGECQVSANPSNTEPGVSHPEITEEARCEKDVTQEQIEPITEEQVQPITEELVRPVTEEHVQPVSEEHVQPVSEEQVQPVIEEPAASSHDGNSTTDQDNVKEGAQEIEDLDQVIVQPIKTAPGETAQELHLAPVVEEVPSADDDSQQDVVKSTEDKDKAAEVVSQPDQEEPVEAQEEVKLPENVTEAQEHMSEGTMDVEVQNSPEPAQRRSGRRVKMLDMVDIQMEVQTRSRRSEKDGEEKEKLSTPVKPSYVKMKGDPVESDSNGDEQKINQEVREEQAACEPMPTCSGETRTHEEQEVDSKMDEADEVAPESAESKHEEAMKSNKTLKERLSHVLRPRETLKRGHEEESPKIESPKVEPPKKQIKRSRGSANDQTTSYEAAKNTPVIKLPNHRSRQTISTSDPISRLDTRFETTKKATVFTDTEKKFICDRCGFATDRLNNLVYHSTKSFCQGKCEIGEVMKADIIRQQQQAKSKRRSIR